MIKYEFDINVIKFDFINYNLLSKMVLGWYRVGFRTEPQNPYPLR